MDEKPQSFANHTQWDPLYHFFVLPVFFLSVVGAIIHLMRHPGLHSGWLFLLSVAATIVVLKSRFYASKLQDRIIRLEERLRLATILSDPLSGRIKDLTEGQLIALRFASDGELPGLVERALSENLSKSDIKKLIQIWRPDYWRV